MKKFSWNRGADITSALTETHYRRSPLVQRGLEILCMVKVEMHPTIKNIQLLDRYEELVKIIYCEHGDLQILDSIFANEMSLLSQSAGVSVGDTHPNKIK